MGNEEESPVDVVRKYLMSKGFDTSGEFRLRLTKEIVIEPVTPHMRLETCLPYPLEEEQGLCPICQREFKDHSYMDYFVKPKHIKAIRNFLVLLMEKHDATKKMYLTLGTQAPDSVLTPKEMVLLLKDLAESDPAMANQFMKFFAHFIPSEDMKFQIEVGVATKLSEIENHYEGLSRKWRSELLLHQRMTVSFTLETEEKEKEKEQKMAEKVLGTNGKPSEDEFYKKFLEEHREDAEVDYFDIQSDFHRVTSRILAYQKLMQTWEKAVPPLTLARMQSERKRQQKAVSPTFIVRPSQKKKSEKR